MKPGAGLISFLLDLSPGPFHLSRHAAVRGQDLAPPGFLWGSFPPTIFTSPKIGKLVADALGSRHEGNGSLESCKVGYSTRIFEASKSPAMKSGRESDGPFLKALMIKYRNGLVFRLGLRLALWLGLRLGLSLCLRLVG